MDVLRPGGLELTGKAFDFCRLPTRAEVLDIGCGEGDTAAYLVREYGLCVTGIDSSAQAVLLARSKHPGISIFEGDGQCLNFEPLSFDCVLMECVLSLMPNSALAIHEAFRVLRDGGFLIIHDLYMPPTAAIGLILEEVGFETLLFEDLKSDLVSFAASLIFAGINIDNYCGAIRDKSEISYCLIIAQKHVDKENT